MLLLPCCVSRFIGIHHFIVHRFVLFILIVGHQPLLLGRVFISSIGYQPLLLPSHLLVSVQNLHFLVATFLLLLLHCSYIPTLLFNILLALFDLIFIFALHGLVCIEFVFARDALFTFLIFVVRVVPD